MVGNAIPNTISQVRRRPPDWSEAADISAGLPPDYEVLRPLGEGTSAVVYLCRERATGREVAIKAFRGALGRRDAQRFQAEADIMTMLGDHPHILTVYRADITPSGLAYLALEHAPNGSVQQLLRDRRFTERQMLDIGIAVASALATAHRKGIVHRDIKPSNILITRRGAPALADFGVAANVYERAATGFSIPWAAPEMLTGECDGNESSDLYALAATLFAMLAGRSPYEYGYAPRTESELVQAIVCRPLPILGDEADGDASPAGIPSTSPPVSLCVASLLAQALNKDPALRPYSAVEFARGMQAAQRRLGFEVTPLTIAGVAPYPARMEGAGPSARAAKDAGQPTSVPEHARTAQSQRFVGIAGVVGVIVALALIAATWLFSDSIPSETSIQVALRSLWFF